MHLHRDNTGNDPQRISCESETLRSEKDGLRGYAKQRPPWDVLSKPENGTFVSGMKLARHAPPNCQTRLLLCSSQMQNFYPLGGHSREGPNGARGPIAATNQDLEAPQH